MTVPAAAGCEAETQELLVRLWTNAVDRARFLSDREAWLAEAAVSPEARQQLRQLDAGQLELFADGLLRKRLGQVRHLLPGTAERFGPQFGARFIAWAGTSSPADKHHHADDALQFGRRLLREPLNHELRDVLRWELLQLRLRQPRFTWGAAIFRHDMRRLGETLLPRRTMLAVWWSVGGRPQLWLWP